ncbi:MAG: hypothetical protein M5U28_29260 [Sandaracinaceae bacterium]|nr:hypothetical protein [Sandaracinaceae bacterium]
MIDERLPVLHPPGLPEVAPPPLDLDMRAETDLSPHLRQRRRGGREGVSQRAGLRGRRRDRLADLLRLNGEAAR